MELKIFFCGKIIKCIFTFDVNKNDGSNWFTFPNTKEKLIIINIGRYSL